MKKVIRLTESDLHNIIKESVENILTETGRYEGEFDRTGLPLDDNEYVESIDYILDSIQNGNISYARKMISQMSISEFVGLVEMAREYGMENDVYRCAK